ncbi:MAG: amidohydrolase [Actinobacteria bacterium]|nr:amidohydrolase [Actinomycetota bacterium]
MDGLRVIALEEHYVPPFPLSASGPPKPAAPDTPGSRAFAARKAKMADVGAGRIEEMDASGIDVQVLSLGAAGLEQLPGEDAVPAARRCNDYLAGAVAEYPDRLFGFAALPTTAPAAAADELERTVKEHGFKGALINGQTQGRFLDDRAFWPIFERAQRLGVPIYLHPAEPPATIRAAYYDGLPGLLGKALATSGWGWHVDTGMHALRMIAGGVFDEFPDLQLIVGHMGEAIPFLFARSSHVLAREGLDRPLEEYFAANIHLTTSGIFTAPPLLCTLMVLGSERVMFSVDYPIADNEDGVRLLREAPISRSDLERISHGNAEHLLGI